MKTQLLTAVLLCALSAHTFAFTKADQLLKAIETGNVALVESLLRHGIDPNLNIESYNTTPLMHAVDTSTVAVVEQLIEHGSKVDVSDNSGVSAAHYVAKKGNENIFKQIKTRVADLKTIDAEGNNILFHGLAGRNKKIINKLIETKQIDLTHKNKAGETAYKVALRNGMPEVAKRVDRGRN